jgi:hypothetical protein
LRLAFGGLFDQTAMPKRATLSRDLQTFHRGVSRPGDLKEAKAALDAL